MAVLLSYTPTPSTRLGLTSPVAPSWSGRPGDERRRGWGLGGSPEGDRRGLSLVLFSLGHSSFSFSQKTVQRNRGARERAVLAHIAGDGVGASPGRVGTHGHQLLLDRSRLRFERESRARVCGRGGLRRSAEAQRCGAARVVGAFASGLEPADPRAPRRGVATAATRGTRPHRGVLRGHAPLGSWLCGRPGLQPRPRRLQHRLSAL